MKMLMLTRYGRQGASSRLRSLQYLPWLAGAGIAVDVAPLFDDDYLHRLYAGTRTSWTRVVLAYWRRIVQLRRARQYDLVVIEKEIFPYLPAWTEQWLATCGTPVLVDYDDAIFHRYDRPGNPLLRVLRGKIDTVMASASTVVCGNDYLAAHARAAGAADVVVIPTAVDLARYRPTPAPARRKCVVGWIGTPKTVGYLAQVLPALRMAAKLLPLRLVVVGASIPAPGVEVECRPWSEDTEAADIASIDVGIMPLPDAPWERGKCAYKLIQYMACARPVVASPVGANLSVVEEGGNGYLAANPLQWRDALLRLASDSALRQHMGRSGRLMVESRYCLARTAPLYIRACMQAAGTGQASARPARAEQWRT
ncbi:MAG: hypothetical protein JWP36_980 [Paucimonas sp.]|nr:hypothetical protein [Paucimonas sp.]